MIDYYLNQTVVWKKLSSRNKYNENTYAADKTIKCRKEDKQKIVKTSTGEEFISSSVIITKEAIGADDLLDGHNVEWVSAAADLSGTIMFYKGYLK